MNEFQQSAVVDQPAFVQPMHDLVMDEGGAALVHQLGLPLRIEILREIAHDPQISRSQPRKDGEFFPGNRGCSPRAVRCAGLHLPGLARLVRRAALLRRRDRRPERFQVVSA